MYIFSHGAGRDAMERNLATSFCNTLAKLHMNLSFDTRFPKTHWQRYEKTGTMHFIGHREQTKVCLAP